MTTPTSSDSREIRLTGITALCTPSDDSNFHDWEFKVELALDAAKIGYVLRPIDIKDRPNTWDIDNTVACTLISRSIDDGNSKFIKPHWRDAHGMWMALRAAHEDSTSGGRMHLLHKLITTKMDGDDVESHINSLHVVYERLDSLITPEAPLTVDDIYTTSILTSLPMDWLPVITPLMQRATVDSATVIKALRNKAT